MRYKRMAIEVESPEEMGYQKIRNNLSESSYTDALFRDVDLGTGLGDLVLAYGSHRGHEGLRELIAGDSAGLANGGAASRVSNGPDRGNLRPDDVLLTIGAAGALFIIATSLLEKEDELIVVRPN